MPKSLRPILFIPAAVFLLTSCGIGSTAETTTTTETPTTTTSVPAILKSFSLTVPGLSAGDCFDDGPSATQVDCNELHDGQVIATDIRLEYSLLETSYKSLWESDAEDKCAYEYKNFVGHEYKKGEGRFKISLLLSDGYSTNVACTVIGADGEKWAGSAKNFVGSYTGVDVGDCLMFPTDVNDAIVVNCSETHEGEMFLRDKFIGISTKDVPYPTRNEWRQLGFKICNAQFYAYTGVSEDDEILSYSFIYPLEQDWLDVSGRTISCIATSASGEQLSYSVRRR
jgi:hypothetical protein